jgi:amidophosphoribosyltransferase
MGKRLAIEQPATADLVVPSPIPGAAAIGYSSQSGISFRFGLMRNHYIGRVREPKQSIRSFGVRIKLNPVRDLIAGKRVILIDDSIVRGTTSKKIVQMVREAGAKRDSHAHQLSANDKSVLLRRGHTKQSGLDRRANVR